jgi:anion-transporting  ArsA/GET3 family ATPase
MASILDKRLIWVTGKGGVGKSTVAAALGMAGARRGRRTIVCEVGEQDRLSRIVRDARDGERDGGSGDRPEAAVGEELELGDGLWATSIDPHGTLREWLATQLGGALARVLFSSSAFQYFAAAAPGAREIATVTKVWELGQDRRWERGAHGYDLVIVDAPASGHGVSMLRTPKTFADLARVGPIHKQSAQVWKALTDRRRTGYVGVALPEEMPVTETIELDRKLADQTGRRLELIVVNGLYPKRFNGEQLERLRAAGADGRSRVAAGALRAAGVEAHRQRAQQAELSRLRRRLRRGGDPQVVTLPYLFEPELGLDGVQRLGRELEKKL